MHMQRMSAAVADFHAQPHRANYPFGPVTIKLPMPATPDDIASLRRLLDWAKGRTLTPTERTLYDALQRALFYLEEPDQRKNVVLYILSALRHSMRKLEGGKMWAMVDRDLHNWAMEQIEDMFPDAGHTEHVTLADPNSN
jgi:hypothetical protein